MTATSYAGTLLAESLPVERVLDDVQLTVSKVYRSAAGDVEAGQPELWTFIEFEVVASLAEHLAEQLSEVLEPGAWYCDFRSDDVFVVFARRIFRYPRGDDDGRHEVEQYGRSVGVPEAQLDWPD